MHDEGDEWEDDDTLDEDKASDESETSEGDSILHEQNESRSPCDNI